MELPCATLLMNMIEHESHSHAHRTGLPWLDLILAGSAIFISVVSLVISIHHGHTMEKLVAANEKQVAAATLPILHFDTSNGSASGDMIYFILMNGGTGPAIIDWFRIKWNGQPTNGWQDLVARCCAGQWHRGEHSTASGTTLPAGQLVRVFQMRRADADSALYRVLDSARSAIEADACYCSVLDECWIADFRNDSHSRPRRVKACEAIPVNQQW